jgi:hypothetical protein
MKLEQLAVPLAFVFGGSVSMATGFLLKVNSTTWLISAAHAIEDKIDKFDGVPQAVAVAFVNADPSKISRTISLSNRAIRYAMIGSQRVDVVGIALGDAEIPPGYWVHEVGQETAVPALAAPGPGTFRMRTPDGDGDKPGEREFTIIGYPSRLGGAVEAVRAVGHGMLPRINTLSLVFSPGGDSGISGGPVFDRMPSGRWGLAGTYTHQGTADLQLALPDGKVLPAVVDVGHATAISVALAACAAAPESSVDTVMLPSSERWLHIT